MTQNMCFTDYESKTGRGPGVLIDGGSDGITLA
jgi:hypothetical protein